VGLLLGGRHLEDIVILLLATAFASDMHPGLANPSVVPSDDRVQLELSGGGGIYTAILSDGKAAGGMFAATFQATDRLRFGAHATYGFQTHCVSGLFWGGRCDEGPPSDVVATASFALVDTPSFRLGPYVAVGTYAQAGVSLWWGLANDRVQFDLSWGPAIDTSPLFGNPLGPRFELDGATFTPDLGWTVVLDQKRDHSLRGGLTSAVPTLTYRWTPGPVGVEATVGSIGLVNIGRIGLTGQF
jgi:hypothetical protein